MKIGLVSTGGDAFIHPIAEQSKHEWVSIKALPDPDIDIIWCEWTNESLIEITKANKFCPIITRCHSYELFLMANTKDGPRPVMELIDWAKVDHIIFVAQHCMDYAVKHYGVALDACGRGPSFHLITNGLDLTSFKEQE